MRAAVADDSFPKGRYHGVGLSKTERFLGNRYKPQQEGSLAFGGFVRLGRLGRKGSFGYHFYCFVPFFR
jgi:hypothetical protein